MLSLLLQQLLLLFIGLQGVANNPPPTTKILLFSEQYNILGEIFRDYLRDILPLVLQVLAFLL